MFGYLKSSFKKTAFWIYNIGRVEYERRLFCSVKALIHNSTRLISGFQIDNHQSDINKIRIGKMTLINGHLAVFKCGGEISIGDYGYVGKDTRIWSAGKIFIGNRVLISHNVNIIDNNTHPLDPFERHLDYIHIITKGFSDSVLLNPREIIIEDDVWIGFNSVILKGVKIGKGAIVGAGTFVTKDIPPYAVVVGNPSKIIKYITPERNDKKDS